ncbi:MAG: lysophospholipid acyltransferase family protein [Myxococcota bacterium]|nr:lysophospholipid acyltransferase family protein [Myxococcota bacterium]
MWRKFLFDRVREKVDRLELDWGPLGHDRYGIEKDHLAFVLGCLLPLYRLWFRVRTVDIEKVPQTGRVMLIGNHSGGLPFDGMMLMSALFFDMDPPRLAHGMVDKMAQRWPVASPLFSRVGQFPGLPEHAIQLLENERALMVFPEGTRGLGKLYSKRYQLERFGMGFARIAMRTGTPVLPFGVIGMEEAYPTIARLEPIARLFGLPYLPVPAHGLPIPLPLELEIRFGDPIQLEGSGDESDEVVSGQVDRVSAAVQQILDEGLQERGDRP